VRADTLTGVVGDTSALHSWRRAVLGLSDAPAPSRDTCRGAGRVVSPGRGGEVARSSRARDRTEFGPRSSTFDDAATVVRLFACSKFSVFRKRLFVVSSGLPREKGDRVQLDDRSAMSRGCHARGVKLEIDHRSKQRRHRCASDHAELSSRQRLQPLRSQLSPEVQPLSRSPGRARPAPVRLRR
jgi:hypothetical protein